MRRSFLIVTLFSLISFKAFTQNPQDRSVKKLRGFYVNLHYPIIDQINKPCDLNQPCDDEGEIFNRTPFNFRTPYLGVGYIVKMNLFFVRTDAAFMYGNKEIEYSYKFDAYDIGDKTSHSTNLFGSDMPQVGLKYYTVDEAYKGNINFYYISINMALGVNLKKGYAIYTGWNINNLIKYNYENSLERHGDINQVISNNYNNNTYQTVNVGEENANFKKNEIANRINQDLKSDWYLTVGVNRTFKIKNLVFFTDFQFDYNILADKTQKHLISLKIGYVFKYSEDFKPSI